MKKGILVTGSLALDTIKTDKDFAKDIVGGSVIYFSHAASLFTDVSLVAVAGDDFPVKFLKNMMQRNIDTTKVEIIKGKKSFHWSGSYEEDINEAKTLDTQLGVFGDFNPQLDHSQKDYETLFLANIDPDLQLSVISQSKAKLIGADSMNLWINIKRDALKKVISKSHILFINETEGKLLTGKKKIYEIGQAVLGMGPKIAVIKQGSYGSSVFYKNLFFSLPIYPTTKVVDPTGAGDSFAGGFMGYLTSQGCKINEKNLRHALAVGTVMASFNVEGFSLNVLSAITISDFKKRFKKYAGNLELSL